MVDLFLVADHDLAVVNLLPHVQIEHVDRADLVTQVNQLVVGGLHILLTDHDLVKNVDLFLLDSSIFEPQTVDLGD